MKKKLIIVTGAGLVSFAGMFVVAWLTGKTPAGTKAAEPADSNQRSEQKLPELQMPAMGPGTADDGQLRKTMTEKQLQNLVCEIRDKIQEYETKLQGLKVREERLQVAHNELKKDIDELNNLRTELASTIAGLKEERDKLEKTRIEIAKTEQSNLISMAATYDKMAPASAGTILTNMSKAKTGSPNDAVKILHYMGDRTKANLLAELANSEPVLAAYFCQKLKQITEEN
jgi:flagellar motility protein MotE (MotC chaperone)